MPSRLMQITVGRAMLDRDRKIVEPPMLIFLPMPALPHITQSISSRKIKNWGFGTIYELSMSVLAVRFPQCRCVLSLSSYEPSCRA
jgi:hypothetical protein